MAIRLSKILFVFSAALFGTLVGIDNIIDYQINFASVQHVLMMDTVFSDNNSMWRAIKTPWLHHLGFWIIILTELAIGVLGFWGSIELWQSRQDANLFNQQKTKAIWSLTLGVLLWFTGFMVIAGEWLLMWQSKDWNAQQAAFRFAVPFLLGLIFVSLKDEDLQDNQN